MTYNILVKNEVFFVDIPYIEEFIYSMFKGFTRCSGRIVNQIALAEARRYNHSVIYPEHVLIGLLKDGSGIAYKIAELVADPVQLQFILEDFIAQFHEEKEQHTQEYKNVSTFYNLDLQVVLSGRMYKCLYDAINKARELGVDELDTFVLFAACCQEKHSKAEELMKSLNISFHHLHSYYHRFFDHIATYENNLPISDFPKISSQTFFDEIKHHKIETNKVSRNKFKDNKVEKESKKDLIDFFEDLEKESKNSKEEAKIKNKENIRSKQFAEEQDKKEAKNKNNIDGYVIDLTESMFHKKNTLYGRDVEIEKIFRILLRKQKSNPLLIGDAGVGKTALVEEIARRICWGEAPLPLLNARILQFDLAAMTAGTRFRGDFEERLCLLLEKIEEQSKSHPVILFIDEFHHLIGAGLSAGTNMDAAGILKPALARGNLCCIGTTTIEEYQKYIEPDKAFVRRVNPIQIEELSLEDTFYALKIMKADFEKKHSVHFEENALKEIVRLTKDYMFDRKLPDKAIDMLDEVGTFYKLEKSSSTPELIRLYHNMHAVLEIAEKKIEFIKNTTTHTKGKNYLESQDTDVKFSQETDKIHNIITRRSALQKALHTLSDTNVVNITSEHVRVVMSNITGIPSDRMDDKKHKVIDNLVSQLAKNVIGQQQACDILVSAVRRSLVGLKEENRAVGSFLFVGPTGVGKTYIAKQLAQNLFGTDSAMTRFDMSDFSEQHSVSRLIGAPPGYVGFEDGGLLVRSVRKKPRQVLLFDEIEKANSKVFDIFLQILEDGILQGQRGEEADFRHCIIIMTSNIGSSEISKTVGLGFNAGLNNLQNQAIHNTQERHQQLKSIVNDELVRTFRPEFINRFDEIVVFNQLGIKSIEKIIDRFVESFNEVLKKHSITVSLSPAAKKLLLDKNFDINYGARSIRRGMREIEDLIASELINEKIFEGDIVCVVMQRRTSTKHGSRQYFAVKKQNPSVCQIKEKIINTFEDINTEEAVIV